MVLSYQVTTVVVHNKYPNTASELKRGKIQSKLKPHFERQNDKRFV